MLANLDNEVIFKKAFTDKIVFTGFVKDILGIDVEVDIIETEKQFSPKIGNIDFKLDIFAETIDKRIAIEIQRIEYDHNFDRFLHYFLALVIEQQKRSKEYGIEQIVYAIVVMTEPFTAMDKRGRPVRDEVILMEINPKNILGETIDLYGHQFMCLNPNHPEESTPQPIRDWLDLIYQSIHNPERPVFNKNNKAILRASELIYIDNLSPQEMEFMKNSEASRTAFIMRLNYEQNKKDEKISLLEKENNSLNNRLNQEKTESEQKRIESIRTLYKNGVSTAIIMSSFSCTKEDIDKLVQ